MKTTEIRRFYRWIIFVRKIDRFPAREVDTFARVRSTRVARTSQSRGAEHRIASGRVDMIGY